MSALAVATPALPEPGQVVEVRGSTWAVANVQTQGLPRSPADESVAQLTHVVDLQSLDEDRLGEQLSVVWELEVGHTVTSVRASAPSSAAHLAAHPVAWPKPRAQPDGTNSRRNAVDDTRT